MLGKKLAKYRRDAGYTQHQLGELLNVSAQAVSKWENDQAEPDLHTLRRLCLIYKIKMDDLFEEEIPEEQEPEKEETLPALVSIPVAAPSPSGGGGGFSRREKGFRIYSKGSSTALRLFCRGPEIDRLLRGVRLFRL